MIHRIYFELTDFELQKAKANLGDVFTFAVQVSVEKAIREYRPAEKQEKQTEAQS
jgi:hypothetical protein